MRTPWDAGRSGPLRDIFGVGAAIQGGAAIAGGIEQANSAANALDFQKQEFNTTQANEAPWLQAGQGALSQLSAGTAPGGSLVQPYGQTFNPGQFTAPTGITEQNDPGYQARLQLGQQALEETAAAQGTQGGGQLQAAENYGQNFASNEYGNVYNRALNTYNTNYQSGLGAFNTNYNVWSNNQPKQYNRLTSHAVTGQTAANNLGQLGQASANNATNLLTGQGNALAAAGVGVGNAVNNGIGNYNSAQLLSQALAQSNGSGYGGGGSYNVPLPPGYDASGSYGEAGAE